MPDPNGRSAVNRKLTGIVCILLTALCWSTIGFTAKLVPWGSMELTGWRGGAGALALFIFLKATRRRIILNKKSIATGAAIALTSFLFMAANKLTTAANAIVLQYTAPIFLIALSALVLKKRFRGIDYLAVLFTVLGIALFFVDELTSGGLMGNILAIVDGFCLSCMYLITGEIDEETRLSGILVGSTLCFLVGAPFAFINKVEVDLTTVLLIIAMGIAQMMLPYVLYSKALKYCPPLACSLIGSVEIILNPLWALLLIGEAPGKWALIGGVVIITVLTAWCILDAKQLSERKQA